MFHGQYQKTTAFFRIDLFCSAGFKIFYVSRYEICCLKSQHTWFSTEFNHWIAPTAVFGCWYGNGCVLLLTSSPVVRVCGWKTNAPCKPVYKYKCIWMNSVDRDFVSPKLTTNALAHYACLKTIYEIKIALNNIKLCIVIVSSVW